MFDNKWRLASLGRLIPELLYLSIYLTQTYIAYSANICKKVYLGEGHGIYIFLHLIKNNIA